MPRRSSHLRQVILSVAGACLVGYFLYHAIEGDKGWLTMLRLKQEVDVAQRSLSQLQKERQTLELRTKHMRPESLDPDLLDEKARAMLGYAKPNEIVVIFPASKETPKTENMLQRSK